MVALPHSHAPLATTVFGQISWCRHAYSNGPMVAQDRHAGSKFLEPRHHRHRHTIYEFDHSNSPNVNGTITGRMEPRYAGRGGTGLAEATKEMPAILFSAVENNGLIVGRFGEKKCSFWTMVWGTHIVCGGGAPA